jgi:hypothetical protein
MDDLPVFKLKLREFFRPARNWLKKHSKIGWWGLLISIVILVSLSSAVYVKVNEILDKADLHILELDKRVRTRDNMIDSFLNLSYDWQDKRELRNRYILIGKYIIEDFYNEKKVAEFRQLTIQQQDDLLKEIFNLSDLNNEFGVQFSFISIGDYDPRILALAYMVAESSFIPNARSTLIRDGERIPGAVGLFQFMPMTADYMFSLYYRPYFENQNKLDEFEQMRRDILHRPMESILINPIWSVRLWFAYYDYLFKYGDGVFSKNSQYSLDYIALAYNGGPYPELQWFANSGRSPDQMARSGIMRFDNNKNIRYDTIIRNFYNHYLGLWDNTASILDIEYMEIDILFEPFIE